jgi:hypothetical protein
MRPNLVHLLWERVMVMRAREIVAHGGEVLGTRKADCGRGLLATVPRPPTCFEAEDARIRRGEQRGYAWR